MKYLLIAFSFLLSAPLSGQYLLSMHTEWDDSFREWSFVVELDDSTTIEGDLDIAWRLDGDFESYDFRVGEIFGDIKQVFVNDPTNWQLRLGDQLISMRQTWPSDPREWKISDGKTSFTIRTRYAESFDDWALTSDQHGEFNVYSEIPGDVRDWVIDDYMSDNITFAQRLAAAFVSIYVSTPKI